MCANVPPNSKFQFPISPKRILVCPLNWGLGHATRCIPVIHEFQRQGAEVFLASDGVAFDLLAKEFPDLPLFELPSYGITYPESEANMVWKMIVQAPRIAQAIGREHHAIKRLAKRLQIDGILSDNRFGCHAPGIPSVLMTHQLNIRAPQRWVHRIVNGMNRHYLQAFEACWIPDVANAADSLSGELSHGNLPAHTYYIGILSRMKPMLLEKRYDLIVVLSGPEPQRTRLEALILEQALALDQRVLLVRGIPKDEPIRTLYDRIEIRPYLTSTALNEALCASRVAVVRSGYSTVMDLAQLGIPALLIPTPGQTEQVYLAKELAAKKIFATQTQGQLDLASGIVEAQLCTGLKMPSDTTLLEQTIAGWLMAHG